LKEIVSQIILYHQITSSYVTVEKKTTSQHYLSLLHVEHFAKQISSRNVRNYFTHATENN